MVTQDEFPGNQVHGLLQDLQVERPYPVLHLYDPGLTLDIGAHVGNITKFLAIAGHRVMAFEPFTGNVDHFTQNVAEHADRITLHRAAVGAEAGSAALIIPSSVSGQDGGWADEFVGSSATASLKKSADEIARRYTDDRGLVARLRGIRRAIGSLRGPSKTVPQETVEVETVDRVVNEHVLMMKVDVQGGEYDVLLGARNTIQNHGIDLIYLEFGAGRATDTRVLEFMTDHDYVVFDTGIRQYGTDLPDSYAGRPLTVVGDKHRSDGHRVRTVFAKDRGPIGFDAYPEFLSAVGNEVDLLCVSRPHLATFTDLAAKTWGGDPSGS